MDQTNELLTPMQYGFGDKMSCTDAIATIIDFTSNVIDKKLTGQACLIDLQKAFDTLDHKISPNTEKLGLRKNINHLFSNYLTDRWQYVSVKIINIKKQKLFSGVPQGSALGLFLFPLYINDLPNVWNSSQIMTFADDTNINNAGKRTDPLIKIDLVTVTKLCEISKLTTNADKCEAMFFSCGKLDNLSVLPTEFGYKISYMSSGLHMDKNLRFRDHIYHVVKKLDKFCSLIHRVSQLNPRKCLPKFYSSFAKSVVNYCLLLYGTAYKTSLFRIELV